MSDGTSGIASRIGVEEVGVKITKHLNSDQYLYLKVYYSYTLYCSCTSDVSFLPAYFSCELLTSELIEFQKCDNTCKISEYYILPYGNVLFST